MFSILEDCAGIDKMLPDYLQEAYKYLPENQPISVLMRHSIRFPIESDAEVWTAGLTPEGVTLAKSLGQWLSTQYKIERFESSPIKRCVDTGEWIIDGIKSKQGVESVDVLAHPNENGEYDAIDHFIESQKWPVRIVTMANYLVPNGNHRLGLNMFISHDTVTITMVAFWLGKDIRGPKDWPRFLEPFFIWWQEDQLIALFRGEKFNVTETYQKHILNSNGEEKLISMQ
jgi:hypothetical protein